MVTWLIVNLFIGVRRVAICIEYVAYGLLGRETSHRLEYLLNN